MGIRLDEMEAAGPGEVAPQRFADVQPGPELLRILSIPRRPIPDPKGAGELATFLTSRLARVSAPYPGVLRPTQALALREAWEAKGGFFPIVAGGGKTATFFLLPVILNAKRPLYICPAMMIPDIQVEWAKMRPDWHGVNITVVSYEKLSSPSSRATFAPDGTLIRHGLLERLAPDLIMLDEAHKAASTGAACTKRLELFNREHPGVPFVAATGTPFKSSIKDCEHVMRWCLNVHSPLPHAYLEREAWASYLDAKKGMGPRAGVGALRDFLTHDEQSAFHSLEDSDEQRAIVRGAIGRRILETPGVIGTQDQPLDTALTIQEWFPPSEDPAIEEAFVQLRQTENLPDGTELVDQLQVARHCTTFGLSFWGKLEPPPPEDWRAARKEWAQWCRRAIKANRRGIDTEGWMATCVKQGLYNDDGALARWEAAKLTERQRTGLLEPPSVAQWLSSEVVDAVRAWVEGHDGLVWVHHIGLGQRLSLELGVPYYHAAGLDARGRHIARHTDGGSAIASILANGTGRNLQKLWSKNLWLTAPGEQSLARTHRPGQEAEVVQNWVYLGCSEHLRSFYAAKQNKARFASEFGLGGDQRLMYAQTSMPTMRQLDERGGSRWSKKESDG